MKVRIELWESDFDSQISDSNFISFFHFSQLHFYNHIFAASFYTLFHSFFHLVKTSLISKQLLLSYLDYLWVRVEHLFELINHLYIQ